MTPADYLQQQDALLCALQAKELGADPSQGDILGFVSPYQVQDILKDAFGAVDSLYDPNGEKAPGRGTLRWLSEYYFAKHFPQVGQMWQVRVDHSTSSPNFPDREFGGQSTVWVLRVGDWRVSVAELLPWEAFVSKTRDFAIEHRNPAEILRVEVAAKPYMPNPEKKQPWDDQVEQELLAHLRAGMLGLGANRVPSHEPRRRI